MNLFIWFGCRNESIKEIQPEVKEDFIQCIWAVRKANLKVSRQRALLDPLKENCMKPDVDHKAAFIRFWKDLAAEPKNPLAEWMDFGVFVFIYLGLYQGIFLHWIDPVVKHEPIKADMLLSLGVVISTVGVYLILKALLLLLVSKITSWKRWLCFMGLFFAYLGVLYISQFAQAGFVLPVWIVLLISGILALWSIWQNQKYFELQNRSELK